MVRKEKEEQDILQQILRGNTVAMKEFYNTYSGYLTTVCSRYISNREDVKDVLQESFIKAFKAVKQFEYKGEGSLKAWTTRIVINEALKHLKKNQKLKVTNMPDRDLPDMADEQEPDFEEIPTSVILEMIRTLPTGYRTVFNLYVFEQKSHKEIASILGIAENSSASQLHRAKSILVKEIELYRTKKMVL
ncbi:RNA polymerase sigma factor [Proteiniphilum sp. X52]|uniref:RNA polymerase sigma factor n=1 Tax=Proteiniphilum sp. X52 TaxID=2382159 RepID=UPI000F0A50C4|nr:RNA polymerase sigma factor [Proteiniphilum sp. X52]RNC67041.1 RNA polymerase sigma factor [Proteiniphilum sp. X52]